MDSVGMKQPLDASLDLEGVSQLRSGLGDNHLDPIVPLETREMEVFVRFQTNKGKEANPKPLIVPETATIGYIKRLALERHAWTNALPKKSHSDSSNFIQYFLYSYSSREELFPDDSCLLSQPCFAKLARHIQYKRQTNERVFIHVFLGIKLQLSVQILKGRLKEDANKINLTITHTETVLDAKKQLGGVLNIVPGRLHLLWQDKELYNDNKRLVDVARGHFGKGCTSLLQLQISEWVIHVCRMHLTFSLGVNSSDTLGEMLDKIKKRRHVSLAEHVLVSDSGAVLLKLGAVRDNGESPLIHLGIHHDSTLYLIAKQSCASTIMQKPNYIEQAEYRGISLVQLRHIAYIILTRCNTENWRSVNPRHNKRLLKPREVTLYDLMHHYIEPVTAAHKCSYVELVTRSSKKQIPYFFCSHWWGGSVLRFVASLERHAYDRTKIDEITTYWICAYALNQHTVPEELRADINPMAGPFYRAMQLTRGTVSILDKEAACYSRIWCAFEVSIVHRLKDREERKQTDPPYLYDVYTIACGGNGESDCAVGLTDGVVASDGVIPSDIELLNQETLPNDKKFSDRLKKYNTEKTKRQSLFPLDTCLKALTVKLERAEATSQRDRKSILNCIVGNSGTSSRDPPETHEAYDLLNNTLRAKFAESGYRLALDNDPGKLERFRKVLAAAPYTRLKLSFESCESFRTDARHFMRALPSKLEHLDLDIGRISFKRSDEFALGLGEAKFLRRLSLSIKYCRALADTESLWTELAKLNALETLRVDLVHCISLSSVVGLDRALSSKPALRTLALDMGGCRLLSSIKPLCDGLRTSTNLKWLKLTFHVSYHESTVGLENAFHGMQMLEQLTLTVSNCDDVSLKRISRGLQSLRRIVLLKLFLLVSHELSDIDRLGTALCKLGSLESLELQCLGSPDVPTAQSIFQGIGSSNKLMSLILSFKDCTRLRSISGLGSALQNMPLLRLVRFMFRNCGILTLNELVGSLESTTLRCLEELSLDVSQNSNLTITTFGFLCSTRFPCLKSLQLRFSSCSEVTSLLGLAGFLQTLPENQLEHLVLNFKGTSVASDDCLELVRVVAACTGLRSQVVEFPACER